MRSVIILMLLLICQANADRYNVPIKEYSVCIGKNAKNPYYLIIKTSYIANTNLINNLKKLDRNTVVINQKLLFMKGNTVLNSRIHYSNAKIEKVKQNGLLLLENVIVEAGIVYGQKGAFYSIAGSGLCNSCSVYSGYFSLDGRLLSEEYVEYSDKYNYSVGSLSDVANYYNLPKNILTTNLNSIWIFPPVKAGKKID